MRRTRRSVRKEPIHDSSSDSEDDIPLKKLRTTSKNVTEKTKPAIKPKNDDSSSSESDIENYLQRVDKIDFSSSFFNSRKETETEFEKIEKNMFSGVNILNDSSDSDLEDVKENSANETGLVAKETEAPVQVEESKLNFQQLAEYTRKIEEAKKQVEEYNAKKKLKEANTDISSLLAKGELKQITLENIKEEDLHPSDFESSEDDWEEVKVKDRPENKVSQASKTGLEITVGEMPDHCKKKKGVDLLSAMKRRLNRIRKENQIYVHKVHLLCWIAHGNFLNSTINNTHILGLALSLLPSDKCYPSDRIDLGYLEQIVQWYKKNIKIHEKPLQKDLTLLNSLQLQINKKEAFDKKMYVLIFVAIMRALGIQCRLVLSFQVEPLRPPASELHSLSKEVVDKKNLSTKKGISKNTTKSDNTKEISKYDSSSEVQNKNMKPSTSVKLEVNVKKEESKENQMEKTSTNQEDSKNNKQIRSVVRSTRISNSKSTSKKEESAKKEGQEKIDSLTINKVKKSSRCVMSNSSKTGAHEKSNLPTISETKKASRGTMPNVPKVITRSRSNPDSKGNSLSKKRNMRNPPQLDGVNDSSDELDNIWQLDGHSDDKKPKKIIKSKTLDNSKLELSKSTCKLRKRASCSNTNDMKEESSGDEFLAKPQKKSKTPNFSKLHSNVSSVKPKQQLDVRNDVINLIKGRISEQKHIDRSKMVKKRRNKYEQSSSDSDYFPEPLKKKHHDSDSDLEYFVPKTKVKKRVSVKRDRPGAKIVSDDSDLDESGKNKKKGVNVWVEVFLEAEEKWITADVVKGQVHCVRELYSRATHPISYIVAWNNNNTLKDVTLRYCKSFSTVTRKLRVDAKWWDNTLKPYIGKETARDREEDEDLNRQQLDQPMPKAISEYKNHPLYALRRHLLKFEDIYPPDIQPLGYVRGEPVYPRNCVFVCKSRDIWLKDAKVVKPGEKPYKIVKARPKYDRLSNKMITDQLLEIFGPWQTMDYDPPTAENGIIPRNAFGNVELFKPCMLPKGTVHLKLPGLNKVCKKLNIDCASAIVGFDFHGGWSHPTYDGFIVCKEFEDKVVAAWELEQEEMEKREAEKIDKRVYGNWRKLIKGLLIRERLKVKYDFGGENSSEVQKGKKSQLKINKRKIVSDSESE
ncbi:DNA repair protein complementing XP-C cells homolog isoform X2 [Leptinotarsa decemlineata]